MGNDFITKGKLMYHAKVLNEIENGKCFWSYQMIGIFDKDDNKIGEYKRNYHWFGNTFYPFKLNDEWYALYSKDYTCTRVMSLPDCKDLGGEEPESNGFCPTAFFVPKYHLFKAKYDDDTDMFVRYWSDSSYDTEYNDSSDDVKQSMLDNTDKDLYTPFGFVAGCVWGDDTSDKLEYIDLSQADKGIIKREAKFGYFELPKHLEIEQCIDLEDYMPEEDEPLIYLSKMERFSV